MNKSFSYYMRVLHRDFGFFVIGITIVYCLSGVLLIYRDTDFLKENKIVLKTIEPNLKESELGKILHIREFKVIKNEGDVINFQNGTYNKTTGVVKYSSRELPAILEKFIGLHKSAGNGFASLFTTIYGILLLFLALSSLWMYQINTKNFRRGIYIACGGLIFVVCLLIL